MKIAFVTDDGAAISRHFGRAEKYLVIEIREGKEINRELRQKLGHQHFSQGEEHHEHHTGQHGFDPVSQNRHTDMLASIKNCETVICGGMGQGTYASIVASGKREIMVEDLSINEALEAYLKDDLKSAENLIH